MAAGSPHATRRNRSSSGSADVAKPASRFIHSRKGRGIRPVQNGFTLNLRPKATACRTRRRQFHPKRCTVRNKAHLRPRAGCDHKRQRCGRLVQNIHLIRPCAPVRDRSHLSCSQAYTSDNAVSVAKLMVRMSGHNGQYCVEPFAGSTTHIGQHGFQCVEVGFSHRLGQAFLKAGRL